MSDKPILFSAPMVRAILEGRKTQTRRLVKPQPTAQAGVPVIPIFETTPYGAPGDRLWVRETWQYFDDSPLGDDVCDALPVTRLGPSAPWVGCQADREITWRAAYKADGDLVHPKWGEVRWRPSIHMPRWASRITLEVTGVRVERLQDISEEDAIAEGLKGVTKDGQLVKYGIPDRDGWPGTDDDGQPWSEWQVDPRRAFAALWDDINAKRAPWASNPWCWVVEFKRVEAMERAA